MRSRQIFYITSFVVPILCFQNCTGGGFQSVPGIYGSTSNGSSSTPTGSQPNPIVGLVNIPLGVNGHDGNAAYPISEAEARFKLLDSKNLRTYRFDIDPRNYTVLDELVRLSKIYKIELRPMVYPMSQDIVYEVAKRYASDIKIWEIANEQDYSKTGAQDRINAMVIAYKGIKQAAAETGVPLKTTINVMACNADDVSADARCPGDKNGAMWFLDMAKASGFNFDYISFHYYAFYGDPGYWMDMYLGQMRLMAAKYNTKIFYNELNCAEIYQGNTDGGFAGDKGCYDSLQQILTVLNKDYKDIVAEINIYEMLDEPTHAVTHEKHFGLLYDVNTPKALFNMVAGFAK